MPGFYYGSLLNEIKLQAIPWEFVFFPSRPALQAPEGAEDCPGAGGKKSNHQLNPIPSHESNVYNQDCEYAVNLILQKDHGLPGLVSSNDHDGLRPADQARPPLPPTASRLKSATDILRLNRRMAIGVEFNPTSVFIDVIDYGCASSAPNTNASPEHSAEENLAQGTTIISALQVLHKPHELRCRIASSLRTCSGFMNRDNRTSYRRSALQQHTRGSQALPKSASPHGIAAMK